MKRQQIEFRRFNHTLGEMEYSSEMAGGLEQFFSNDCCSELADDEQFTGIHDCNEVKIFEGDIFSDGINYCIIMLDSETSSFVAFDGYERHKLGYHTKREMIIGNIHQNKELLGATK